MHTSLTAAPSEAKKPSARKAAGPSQAERKREHQRQVVLKRLMASGKMVSGEERLKYMIHNDAAEDKDGVLSMKLIYSFPVDGLGASQALKPSIDTLDELPRKRRRVLDDAFADEEEDGSKRVKLDDNDSDEEEVKTKKKKAAVEGVKQAEGEEEVQEDEDEDDEDNDEDNYYEEDEDLLGNDGADDDDDRNEASDFD